MRLMFPVVVLCLAGVNVSHAAFPLALESHGSRYVARGAGFAWNIAADGAVLDWGRQSLRIATLGADLHAHLEGLGRMPGHVTYMLGTTSGDTYNLYGQVRCRSVYRGVDMVYHGNQDRLEYDFYVAPRSSAGAIVLGFPGADSVDIDASGDLILRVGTHASNLYLSSDIGVEESADGGQNWPLVLPTNSQAPYSGAETSEAARRKGVMAGILDAPARRAFALPAVVYCGQMPLTNSCNRRRFVGASLATAASYSRILGANDRVRVGAIGTGSRGQTLLGALNQLESNDIVAICDVYKPHLVTTKAAHAPNAQEYGDHRAVLDRKDVDAVVIATPDHWHVRILTDAVQAGKDAYCEKPVTHTLEEGEPVIAAVRESERIVQIGLQQRSWAHFAQAREEIANDRLGQVTFIRTYWYQNHLSASRPRNFDLANLDWKRFLGNASDRPFDADQYGNWRWYWDFGSGAMTDLFVHWVDVAHWIMGVDMPSRATANGFTAVLQQRQTPDTMSAALSYPGHAMVEFDCALLGYLEGGGLMIRGTKAAMRLWRGGFSVYQEFPRYNESPEPAEPIMQVKSTMEGTVTHMKNFLECLASRKTPNAPIEVGVSAARAGHVANLAMRGTGVWNRG